MSRFCKQKRVILSGQAICLLLCIAFGPVRTEAGILNETEPQLYGQDYFFSGFYKNSYYLRINNDFEVFPGVNNPLWLSYFVLKQSLRNYLTLHFPPTKWWFEEDPVQRRFLGKPLCSSVRVDWEDSVMQGFLAIHSGCVNDAYPVWQFSAAPTTKNNCIGRYLPFEMDDEEWTFCQLWSEMNSTGIERVLLQPFEQEGKNKLNLYLCALKKGCYRIEVDMDLGRHSEHPWLLTQLAFQQLPASGTISALHHKVLKNIVGIMHCLSQRDGFPAKGEYFQCKHEPGVFRQSGEHWAYHSTGAHRHYPFTPWLYNGRDIRILPLSTCYTSGKAGYHRCNSYLFQGSDYSSQPLATGLGKPVLHIGFDRQFRNYQQHYLRYDLTGIGEYFRPVNYAELMLTVMFGSPQLAGQMTAGHTSGFARDQYIKPMINAVELFDASTLAAAVPVREGVLARAGYSGPGPEMSNPLLTAEEPQGIMKQLADSLQSFNQWLCQDDAYGHDPGDMIKAPVKKVERRNGKRSSQDQDRHPAIPRFARQAQNHLSEKKRERRADDDPPDPEPPLSGLSPPVVVISDVDDLLRVLQYQGLVATGFPMSPFISEVLAQSNQPMAVARMYGNLTQQVINRGDLLYHPLIQSSPTYLLSHILIWWGFQSNLDSHIALLSELLKGDVAVLIALQPGQHRYCRYVTMLQTVVKGRVADSPEQYLGADIILVQGPEGFLKVERFGEADPQSETPSVQEQDIGMAMAPRIPDLLPASARQMIEAYQSWPWFDGGEQESRILFNQIALERLREKDNLYLYLVCDYLARKGHISFPLRNSLETGQFRFSKTLLGWFEQFWEMNHEELARDNSLFLDASHHGLVLHDIRKASLFRKNLAEGFASEDYFSKVFVDIALPVVKLMVDQQKLLVSTIAEVVNQFFGSGTGIACYGGMAKRSHLIQKAFAGNLAAATEEGALLPVNDVDLMMFDAREMDMFISQLLRRLNHNFPWLNIVGPSEIITGQEHLTTRKIILYWRKTRFFTIDVSYSKQYGYFDFSELAQQSLFIDSDYSPSLPMISFAATVRQLILESFNNGDGPDSERRSYLARRYLWLLKDSSPFVPILLSEAYPGKDWRQLFYGRIYGAKQARGTEPPASYDNPEDSGHESAGEEFSCPSESADVAIESLQVRQDELSPMVTESVPDEPVPEQPGTQDKTVATEEKTLYLYSEPVAMPLSHNTELTVNKQWSASALRWHIPPWLPSLNDAPVTEPVKRNPFSSPRLVAALKKAQIPGQIEYNKVSPDLMAATKARLDVLYDKAILPASGVTAMPTMPSQLGAYFNKIDSVYWHLGWISGDVRLKDNRWFIPSLPVSVQGKLWLWSALDRGGFFQTGERLQITRKINDPGIVVRLYIAQYLGNHVAGYLVNELEFHKEPVNLAVYQVIMRWAAPFVPQALRIAVQRMLNAGSQWFDPEGIVRLVRHAVVSEQNSFPHDITDSKPVSRTVLAVIEALKILPENNPTDQQREEAASWLLQVLADPVSVYQPGVVGIMLVSGLESFLPEDWQKMCSAAPVRGRWVCSWAVGRNTPELKATPAWHARNIRQKQVFSSKATMADYIQQYKSVSGQLPAVMHAGHLLFNLPQWLKGLKAFKGLVDTTVYNYLERYFALLDPRSAAPRIQARPIPSLNDRITLGIVYEQLGAKASTDRYSGRQRQRLARLYPTFSESMLWAANTEKGTLLTEPGQMEYSFDQAVLTPREQEILQYYLPSHPEFRQISEKLVFAALVESGAWFKRDGKQLQVSFDSRLLATPAVYDKLQKAVFLDNPEACWLLFLSAKSDMVNPLVVELKLAARVLPAARRQAIRPLLTEGPWFDPVGLLALYKNSEPVSDASLQREYVTADVCRGSCLVLDQYLQAVANARSEKDWDGAWQIIADSPFLTPKKISIQYAEVIILIVTGQYQRLDQSIQKKLNKQLNGKSPLARYLSSFLPDKTETGIVEAMNSIVGDTVDPGFFYEDKSRGETCIKGIKVAMLVRKLAISEPLRKAFADELIRLQEGGGEQKELAQYWLYRVMYAGGFLFNYSLSFDLAQKVHNKDKTLGLIAFGAILRWHPAEYPRLVLGRLLLLNKEWREKPDVESRSIFTTGYLGFLVDASHDERLTKELKELYQKSVGFLKSARNPILLQDIETAERKYLEREAHLRGQLDARLKYTPEWLRIRTELANIKIEKLLELLSELEQNEETIKELTDQLVLLEHPVGLFMQAWLHWKKYRSFTSVVRYRYLYPAARQFLPALKLLYQEVAAIDLSALMVERIRLGWGNMDSASAGLEKWNQPFLQLVESNTPDNTLLDFIWVVNRAPADVYRMRSLDLPPPLVSQIHTAGVMKYYNELLDAVAAGNTQKQHEATIDFEQAKTAFNEVGATTRAALFDRLTEGAGIEELPEPSSPYQGDDRILQLSGFLNLAAEGEEREKVARMLIDAVGASVNSEQELGWALGWLPQVQQRYRIIRVLVRELGRQGKYAAIAELFEALKDWSVGNSSESYIEVLGFFVDYMIQHFQHFQFRLEPALEFYLAELIHNNNDDVPFMAYAASLVLMINSCIEGSQANHLHGIVVRYAIYQTD